MVAHYDCPIRRGHYFYQTWNYLADPLGETMHIYPVIICGGIGTRLWPLSRKSYPKQFTQLITAQSLFQGSVLRVANQAFNNPLIVTNNDFRFIVSQQLHDIGIKPGAILLEPEGRNTAPAVLAASLYIQKQDPEALLLVMPADHIVPDVDAFIQAVLSAEKTVMAGDLVTFGITPDRPETGYGYLELASEPFNQDIVKLNRFVEKPDSERAAEMLKTGLFLWNSGIFFFSLNSILAAFQKHAPHLIGPVQEAVGQSCPDLEFVRLAPEPWAKAEKISIDYAIMEKAGNLSVVPFSSGWSDLGSWESVWGEQTPDEAGVSLSGPVTAIDCSNSLLRSEDEDMELVGIGLNNIVAIAMSDAVLVADKSRSQEVEKAVGLLQKKNANQSHQLPVHYRPWGRFRALSKGSKYQVKQIVVNPGESLSLQSHLHRAEHWVVVEGTALVTLGEKKQLITENQSIYIPIGEIHRLENPGKLPLVVIEVQTGAYFEEDDIIRYGDAYDRC